MRKIEKIEKCQRTSKSTLNKNRGRMESMLKYKAEQGITLVALVITMVLHYDKVKKCSNSNSFLLSSI